MDEAVKGTERILKKLSKEVFETYRTAMVEMENKLAEYLSRFVKDDTDMRNKVAMNIITQEEYIEWRNDMVLTTKQMKDMIYTLAEDMSRNNEIALSIINGYMPEVYALNYNYATYEIEKGIGMSTNFTLYDRQTVERLFREDTSLLKELDVAKDMRWNRKLINSQIRQSILQGESIPKVAERMVRVVGMNHSSAVRNARTMITSAQNGGRIDSYRRARSMGIKLKKQWLATVDGRTRHTHRLLDGVTVDIDEPFKTENGELMFPADPKGFAGDVYNCRCTLIAKLEGHEYDMSDREIKSKSYEDWLRGHK